MRRPESGQVILGGCVHHGSDFQPEGELVSGLHQRPHSVPRPVTESTERSPKPAGPSLQPRQCQSGKATSRVGFRIKSRTLQRADLVIKPLPGFPRRRPTRRAPGYPPAAMADTEEHGSATASVRGISFYFLNELWWQPQMVKRLPGPRRTHLTHHRDNTPLSGWTRLRQTRDSLGHERDR